jgi:hypothetical protein
MMGLFRKDPYLKRIEAVDSETRRLAVAHAAELELRQSAWRKQVWKQLGDSLAALLAAAEGELERVEVPGKIGKRKAAGWVLAKDHRGCQLVLLHSGELFVGTGYQPAGYQTVAVVLSRASNPTEAVVEFAEWSADGPGFGTQRTPAMNLIYSMLCGHSLQGTLPSPP